MGINFRGTSPELQTLCEYQFPRLADENNCTRFGSYLEGGEEEDDEDAFFEELLTNQQPSKRHVFANVWERSLDPRGGCHPNSFTDTWTIDWRQWPPDVPRISQGVKIPINLAVNSSLRVLEATPLNSGSVAFYQSLKGLFNPCQTSSLQVSPPALLFLNSRKGQFYSVKLHLKNVDVVPHRVKIIPPKNQCFSVAWTSHRTSIVPGLAVPILVQYKPASNASVNEILYIVVEGAGGLTVPLIACSEPPPILEFEEWDCGCSVLRVARTTSFEIKNAGSEGRFWLLTEDEFRYQYIAYPKRRLPESNPNGARKLLTNSSGGVVQVIAGPFSINTACFKLLRNQRIKIQVSYTPKTAGLHYEKLAVMCDNGEVRWIAVKGIGIDMHYSGLIDLQVASYWTAPPVDLPFDEKCRFALDFADLLPGDIGQAKFRAINKSCISMYYFWSVRPLKSEFGGGFPNTIEGNNGRSCFSRFPEATLQPSDIGHSHHHSHQKEPSKKVVDLRILPSQGILRQRQMTDFTVSAPSPQQIGYYACVISLFVEQLEDTSSTAICGFINELENIGMNDVPIHLDFLKKSMLGKTGGRHPPSRPKKLLQSNSGEGNLGEEDDEEEEEDEGELEFIMPPRSTMGGHPCAEPKKFSRRSWTTTDSSGRESGVDNEIKRLGEARRPRSWGVKNLDVLKPIVEVEIWLRCMPLEVRFSPPVIVGRGSISSRVERVITVTNDSQWPVQVQLPQLMEVTSSICCEPNNLTLQPLESADFTAIICLKNHGKMNQPLTGTMNVLGSKVKVPFSIHCSITCTGPYITALTPLVHFGFIQMSCEKMKTIAIQNIGDRPARCVASVNAQDLYDFDGHNLSPYNCTVEGMKLLRVWPSWGVLEPQETMGINVYLSAEIEGDFVASITVSVEDVADSSIYIPVCAVVQNPFLFLEESEIFMCQETLQNNKVEDSSVTLVNPTGFPITFVWQPCLIGRQSQMLSVEFCPQTGFVPGRGTMDVVLSLSANSEYVDLRYVYAVCMVDGMKEPLILKISSDFDME